MTWLIAAGRWLASNPIAQAVVIVIAALGFHQARVWSAKQSAVKAERKAAKAKTVEAKAQAQEEVQRAREKLAQEQQARRKERQGENPRARFDRDPFD